MNDRDPLHTGVEPGEALHGDQDNAPRFGLNPADPSESYGAATAPEVSVRIRELVPQLRQADPWAHRFGDELAGKVAEIEQGGGIPAAVTLLTLAEELRPRSAAAVGLVADLNALLFPES